MPMTFPHLTDTESVRAEAASQYGGLNDAAAFQQAWKASQDPNYHAAALKRVNPDETAKVQDDLSLAQGKIDEAYGDGTYRVLDAVVRGNALSVVVEGQEGRPEHKVVGWNERYRPIARSPEQEAEAINQQAEAHKIALGAEARAEIDRRVREATDAMMSKVQDLIAKATAKTEKVRDEAIADATEGEGSGSGSTSPSGGGSASTSPAGGNGGNGEDPKWPTTHDELDALAAKNNVTFDEGDTKVAQKIEALKKAGVTPDEE